MEKKIIEGKERIKDIAIINENYHDYLRVIHNELQEAKGNIRVFCRVRPKIGKEIKEESTISNYIEIPNQNTIIINGPITKSNVGNQNKQSKDTFHFDKVFGMSDNQEEIFKEISQLIQSALDGYKVCIFAYGQTGSGKTYTMEGNCNDPSSHGIIQRSSEKIFATAKELNKLGWKFKIELSFVEVYLDTVRDLLSESDDNIISKGPGNNFEKHSSFEVNSFEEMLPYLKRASKSRVTAETKCNEESSRSHRYFLKYN